MPRCKVTDKTDVSIPVRDAEETASLTLVHGTKDIDVDTVWYDRYPCLGQIIPVDEVGLNPLGDGNNGVGFADDVAFREYSKLAVHTIPDRRY